MKIYHYTDIESLALILKNRTIRFNRLDKVDDIEEDAFSHGVHLGQYVFVSCWTKDPEESLPLWKMYGGMDGVRICLDDDMFPTYYLHDLKLKRGIHTEGTMPSLVPQKDIEAEDYMIMPIDPNHKSSFFFRDVEYVDNVDEKISDVLKNAAEEENLDDINIEYSKIGRYKNKRWAFQEECRFVLNVFPFNPLYENAYTIKNVYTQSFLINKPLPFNDCFLKLKDEVIDNIEVTIGPKVTPGQKVIIESLCKLYSKNGRVVQSKLTGLIR